MTRGENAPAPVTISETRIFLEEKCQIVDAGKVGPESIFAVIGGALISAAIDKGFDLLAGAIRKAGEAETLKSSATTGAYFHAIQEDGETVRANAALGCVVAIKGSFGPSKAAKFTSDRWKETRYRVMAEKYKLIAEPEIYFEGNLEFSIDNSSFRVQAQHLEFNKPGLGGWSAHELVMALTFSVPGSGDSGKAFAVGLLNFGKLSAASILDESSLATKVTRWMPLPDLGAGGKQLMADYAKISAEAKTTAASLQKLQIAAGQPPKDVDPAVLALDKQIADAQGKLDDARISRALTHAKFADGKKPAQQSVISDQIRDIDALTQLREQRAKLTLTSDLEKTGKSLDALKDAKKSYAEGLLKAVTPFDLEGTFIETRDANKFLLAVADILDGSKATITQAAKEELVPSERKKADLANTELELEAFKKERAVVELEAELAELGDDASVSTREKLLTKIAVAKREADIAARKAGKTPPFGT